MSGKFGIKYLEGAAGIIRMIALLVAVGAAAFLSVRLIGAYDQPFSRGNSILSGSSDTEVDIGSLGPQSYENLSLTYKNLEATNTEWTEEPKDGGKNGLYCIAKENPQYSVYNIDTENICGQGMKLQDFDHMWINSEDDYFYSVINMSGKVVDLTDYYILARDESGIYASRVLINCYEAEVVILENAIFTGTLLAPNAKVIYNNTFVYGEVLAKSGEGTQAFYKETSFTGHDSIIPALSFIEFTNDEVRVAAIQNLKENDVLGRYEDYTAQSKLRRSDVDDVTVLDLKGVQLTDINSDLIHFTNLRILYVDDSGLDSLDVTSLVHLVELSANNNSIRELNVTGMKNLQKLSINNTKITELDISKCPNLEILSYRGTQLGNLNMVGLSRLKHLDCSDSGMTDPSVITSQKLESLYISDNPGINAIDISGFSNLKLMDCSNCSLEELDISKNGKLYYLKASHNKIVEFDVTANARLTHLELYGDTVERIYGKGNITFFMYYDCEYIDVSEDVEG